MKSNKILTAQHSTAQHSTAQHSLRRRLLNTETEKQKIGENLFTDWIENMWIKDGVESGHQNTSITSWVDIYPEYTYAMEVPVINYGVLRTVYFYDSDKTYISKLDYNLWNHIQVQKVDMPEGTRYVRTSQYSAQKGFLLFYRIA